MNTPVVHSGGDQNALYWHRRLVEMTRTANALRVAVSLTVSDQRTLTLLSETAKIGNKSWESAMSDARAHLRLARMLRTKFRKQIYGAKDTIRINTHLARAVPTQIMEAMEQGERYLEYLEAHGF